jgi:16S rRNA (cytosine1402-N4)-methyltransferase
MPVLLNETIDVLLAGGGTTYVDCTVGTGGHSYRLLSQTPEDVVVIGIDKDEQSLEIAKDRLKEFGKRVTLLKGGYEDIDKIVDSLNPGPISGILFDLGMSSFQLDKSERGFSFRYTGPLDMRFNGLQDLSAEKIINTFPQEDLLQLFRKFGEEKWARRLSRVIVEQRTKKPFETTVELSDFIRRNIPRRTAHKTLARVFQAIRITVNNELDNLKLGLLKAFKLLEINGRIVVISYHSLEDRITKNLFHTLKKAELLEVINPKCVRPSKSERMKNRRSRSARFRAIIKKDEIREEITEEEMDELETEEEWGKEGNN